MITNFSLVLTDAIIMEVLRFRNPTPITIPHSAINDTLFRVSSIIKFINYVLFTFKLSPKDS